MDKSPPSRKQLMVISLLAKDTQKEIYEFSKNVYEHKCSIDSSHMVRLGQELSITALVSGSWDSLVKLENSLQAEQQQRNWQLASCRTTTFEYGKKELLPYTVEFYTVENIGIISRFAEFFLNNNISIAELSSQTYTSHTMVSMHSLGMRVYIPADYQLNDIRERFLLLCDELNIDGILEPERS